MTSASNDDQSIPLCVDLDGSLIKTDLLAESLLRFVKENPFHLLLAAAWLLRGKAHLKSEIAKRVEISAASLPYNLEVLEYIKKQQRKVILVTGSNGRLANEVAEHLGVFDRVFASDADTNLTKSKKRKCLVEAFGEKGFDYVGDHSDDWEVWPAARQVLVVARDGRFLERTRAKFKTAVEFKLPSITVRDFIKAIRVHQWVKNTLIFIPYILEHQFDDLSKFFALVLAFFCLSFLASSTYIINDLLDLEADRKNKTKRLRAFASGLISVKHAVIIMSALFATTLALAAQLNPPFQLILAVYLISTLSYTLFFKNVVMLDVCILAGMYTLRVIGGGVVIEAEWSFWLLAFSMFLFFSLALVKRVSELENLKNQQGPTSAVRGYRVADLPVLIGAGISSGMLSILVVALYINAEKVLQMYAFPQALWLICPLLLYWISRIWIHTVRGEMHEDPILFAIRDRVSLLTAGFAATIVLCAVLLRGSFS